MNEYDSGCHSYRVCYSFTLMPRITVGNTWNKIVINFIILLFFIIIVWETNSKKNMTFDYNVNLLIAYNIYIYACMYNECRNPCWFIDNNWYLDVYFDNNIRFMLWFLFIFIYFQEQIYMQMRITPVGWANIITTIYIEKHRQLLSTWLARRILSSG